MVVACGRAGRGARQEGYGDRQGAVPRHVRPPFPAAQRTSSRCQSLYCRQCQSGLLTRVSLRNAQVKVIKEQLLEFSGVVEQDEKVATRAALRDDERGLF
jgi:hypothetical protein